MLLTLCGALASAQTWPASPDIELKPDGFKVAHTVADRITFVHPLPAMKIKRSNLGETVYQGQDFALSPSGVAVSPFRPGAKLYFPLGARLRATSDLAPYLSWGEGSAGPDVPTAPSRWLLLSFRDGQPPILLTFESPKQWIVTGESGRWSIDPVDGFKGWIRFCAPLGTGQIGSSVGALGEAVQKIKPLAQILAERDPYFESFRVRAEADALVAVWEFDAPGAMLPMPLMLTKPGGYATQVLSQATPELASLYGGPIAFSREKRIAVRFPARAIPPGRAVCVGQLEPSMSSASGFDVPSVYELAALMLCAPPDSLTQDAANSALDEYRRSVVASTSPWLPLGDADVMAAQALLSQANLAGTSNPDTDLIERLAKSLDLWSWQIPAASLNQSVRASALFSLVAAFAGDSDIRLRGAMAHAGSVALSMQSEYRKRRGIAEDSLSPVRPLLDLRQSLYSSGATAKRNALLDAWMSPVRLVGQFDLTVEPAEGGYLLTWIQQKGSTAEFALASKYPLELEARQNLAQIVPTRIGDEVQLRIVPQESGRCRLMLKLPTGAPPLPSMPPAPRYSE